MAHLVKNVFIINKTSSEDEGSRIEALRMDTQDFMFTIEDDMTIHLGHHPNNLNLFVLLPKTDKRSAATDVMLKKMVESRTKDLSIIQFLHDKYSGKNALNIRRMKIKVDLYSLKQTSSWAPD